MEHDIFGAEQMQTRDTNMYAGESVCVCVWVWAPEKIPQMDGKSNDAHIDFPMLSKLYVVWVWNMCLTNSEKVKPREKKSTQIQHTSALELIQW